MSIKRLHFCHLLASFPLSMKELGCTRGPCDIIPRRPITTFDQHHWSLMEMDLRFLEGHFLRSLLLRLLSTSLCRGRSLTYRMTRMMRLQNQINNILMGRASLKRTKHHHQHVDARSTHVAPSHHFSMRSESPAPVLA